MTSAAPYGTSAPRSEWSEGCRFGCPYQRALLENIPDLGRDCWNLLLIVRRRDAKRSSSCTAVSPAIVRETTRPADVLPRTVLWPWRATDRATVDVRSRFWKLKESGGLDLTRSRYQSGEIDWSG